jgi:hypothetical protein
MRTLADRKEGCFSLLRKMSHRIEFAGLVLATALAGSAPVTAHAEASIDPAQAASIFQQAAAICARDGGALWGHTLCGPMLLVDPNDRSVVANQPDAGGVLQRAGAVYIGVLPPAEPLADTTMTWSGTRWCELLWPWPLREDPDMRQVTLAHELFHRIQEDDLHIGKLDGDNSQLDTRDGRYLIELEWRALAAALQASKPGDLRTAAADAILFRRERYRLFPAAATNELALESNEGIAEYTGVRLGLPTPQARMRYALRDLSTWAQVPSFVRSFAYATGPAYGLLLDETDSGWLRHFVATQRTHRFDQRLSAALHLAEPDLASVQSRAAVYDPDGSLRAREVAREQQNRAQLIEYQAKLIEGAVLKLPLAHAAFEFKPQSLVTIETMGTVYPTMTLRDEWGTLTVESGGALVRRQPKEAVVSAAGFDPATGKGPGFTLTLKPGWNLLSGARPGDLIVGPMGGAVP